MLINQFLRSTSDLLSSGGDDRQTISEAVEQLNKYFSSALPRPEVIRRGSCTCSTVNSHGFMEADNRRHALIADLLQCQSELSVQNMFDEANQHVISRLESIFKLNENYDNIAENERNEIVLLPSGSDAEYLPLVVALIRSYNLTMNGNMTHNTFVNHIKVHNNVIASGEVGSGTSYACSGQHFSTVSPKDSSSPPLLSTSSPSSAHQIGEYLTGIDPAQIELVEFKPRDIGGVVDFQEQLIIDTIHSQLSCANTAAVSVLHIVLGSKTGLIYPSLATVQKLTTLYKERLIVVVDACQTRCDMSVLRDFVEKDQFIVLFTGESLSLERHELSLLLLSLQMN